ncbi:hypothetical protein [Acinetobacter wuhouensis]|uniref:DUF3077 domain-containing protein n=1 Tax=Acinetobacter wuhouensis TaxID=1879050 RepID=A0A4Q7AL57_9GAMM|nr:hypothetical protein [Acinetobacter wuhouensis]RZG46972.1 hypothetical protein EXU28_07205 [Acinetobacter wuhouensis]
MPNQNINAVKATVTTHRSNSIISFFDTPKDATPQDCLVVADSLIDQATAILNCALFDENLSLDTLLQLQAVRDNLYRASQSLDMLDIAKAVEIALVEG